MEELKALGREILDESKKLNVRVADVESDLRAFKVDAPKAKRRSNVAVWVSIAALLGLLMVGFANHATCTRAIRPLHTILVQAQTSSDRNPIPPNLSEEEKARVIQQREASRQFFARAIKDARPSVCSYVPWDR